MFQRHLDVHIYFDHDQFDRLMDFLEAVDQAKIDLVTERVRQVTQGLKSSEDALKGAIEKGES